MKNQVIAAVLLSLMVSTPAAVTAQEFAGYKGKPAYTQPGIDDAPSLLEIILEGHVPRRGEADTIRDMTGANFSKQQLTFAYFRRALLSGANFSAANLVEANFQQADLSGANFTGAVLMGADLRRANLNSADLRGANLTNVRFKDTAFYNAMYNEHTDFPRGFIPQEFHMVFVPNNPSLNR